MSDSMRVRDVTAVLKESTEILDSCAVLGLPLPDAAVKIHVTTAHRMLSALIENSLHYIDPEDFYTDCGLTPSGTYFPKAG